MNERIRELSEQARQYAESKMHLTGVKDSAAYDEKFAQLIVQECLGIIDEEGSHEGGSIRSMEAIKEHFGVEE